jgi:plastocyanin
MKASRRPLRLLPLLVLAVLAAALVVLPAVAGSETSPTIEAENTPAGVYSEEHHAWAPSQVTVGEGGVVTLKNPGSTISHGVQWVGGPATPTCSAGVPVGTTAASSGTNWSGTCTFAHPGTYTFYCTVHGREMTGTIVVAGAGTPPPGPSPGPEGGPAPPGGSGPGGSSGAAGSPFAGGTHALRLTASQHGPSVHGSIDVSSAGAGGRLEVALFASSASLAAVHRTSRVRIGRYVRSSVHAGVASFAVGLTARARAALRRHKRLAVNVRVLLTPAAGAPGVVSRSVVLHR